MAVLAACANKVPETRFYQLAEPRGESVSGSGVSVVVDTLAADSAYDDDRIVYRLSPYRLDYYNYHRWSAPPGTLIANYLERALENSGQFGVVTREPNTAAAVTLGGRVVAIEEVDVSRTSWVGHVVLELTLTDSATGDVLWSEQFEEREPLPVQSPEGLARALSVALERIAKRVVPVVAMYAVTARAGRAPTRPRRAGSARDRAAAKAGPATTRSCRARRGSRPSARGAESARRRSSPRAR
jgi:ABC-type uncharacterized transport system auxiliary subunit